MSKDKIITSWKTLARNKQITSALTLAYIIYRASDENEALYHIRRAFSPIKSTIKLANGREPYDCLWTGDNHLLRPRLINGDYGDYHIKKQYQLLGIEPTDEVITKFRKFYGFIMDKVRN